MDNCVSEVLIRQVADAIVARGLKAVGYEYVNLDDCWMAPSRDAHGQLMPDPTRFPSGMANLSAYVHARGLKIGIYEASGSGTCCGFPGTDGPTHAVADVDTFSNWSIDFLKWDGCGPGAGGDYNKSYTAMYRALTRTDVRPMVYSCSWPAYINIPGTCTGHPVDCDFANVGGGYRYLAKICNMWRLYSDITDAYSSGKGNPMGFADIAKYWAQKQDELAPYAGPGHWNDPDMIEIGNSGQWGEQGSMTPAEKRSHMALWSFFAAPLILGGDVRTMSADDLALVSNRALIGINQDREGKQGKCIRGCPEVHKHPWGQSSLANFTHENTGMRQVFTLPSPMIVPGFRFAVFSQYSKWQPMIREMEFQTGDGAWVKNLDGCTQPSASMVDAASGEYRVPAPGLGIACAAADGKNDSWWNAVSEPTTGKYWIDVGFGGNLSLSAFALTGFGDRVHEVKDFGLLPWGSVTPRKQAEQVQLWTKPLSDGSIAALIFNAANASQGANFSMREIGLGCDTASVRSVWAVGGVAKRLSVVSEATIERHDSAGFICKC
jgi:alpha-N-acetylgalactosaminidase